MTSLFCFGFGYTARTLACKLTEKSWRITGTIRSEENRTAIAAAGYEAIQFASFEAVASALAAHSHILISIPPGDGGDPVLAAYAGAIIANKPSIRWIGYLSSTGVYGDRSGGWVDETSPLAPATARGRRRLAAENQWLALHTAGHLPVHIFRLAAIYGPGRNQLLAVRNGTAKRIVKPGQIFSRIHVDDLAGVLEASMARPNPGRFYNLCDDEPAPPQDVVAFAAQLMGATPPPAIPVDQAGLSGLSRSFYEESKRVSNRRIKEELGYRLLYPTYREGLRALKTALLPVSR